MFFFFLNPLSFFLLMVVLIGWLAIKDPASLGVLFNITVVILIIAVLIVYSVDHNAKSYVMAHCNLIDSSCHN